MDFAKELDATQVELISALLSFASVVVAAVSAPIIFFLITRRGVADFRSAIAAVTASASEVKLITVQIRTDIEALQTKLVNLDALMSAVLIRQSDLQAQREEPDYDYDLDAADVIDGQSKFTSMTGREQLRTLWEKLRGTLEKLATDPDIDGKFRAKYARIDRRNYYRLAYALNEDGNLPATIDTWNHGIGIWHANKRRKEDVPKKAIEEMQMILRVLSDHVAID